MNCEDEKDVHVKGSTAEESKAGKAYKSKTTSSNGVNRIKARLYGSRIRFSRSNMCGR